MLGWGLADTSTEPAWKLRRHCTFSNLGGVQFAKLRAMERDYRRGLT
jgi:hypothetical protein